MNLHCWVNKGIVEDAVRPVMAANSASTWSGAALYSYDIGTTVGSYIIGEKIEPQWGSVTSLVSKPVSGKHG